MRRLVAALFLLAACGWDRSLDDSGNCTADHPYREKCVADMSAYFPGFRQTMIACSGTPDVTPEECKAHFDGLPCECSLYPVP